MHHLRVTDPSVNLKLLLLPDPSENLELLIHLDPCVNLELLIHPGQSMRQPQFTNTS